MHNLLVIFSSVFCIVAMLKTTNFDIAFVIFSLFAVAFLLPFMRKSLKFNTWYQIFATVLLSISLCVTFVNFYTAQNVTPLKILEGRSHNIVATVMDYPEIFDEGVARVLLRFPDEITGKEFETLCYIDNPEIELLPNDKIHAKVTFYKPSDNDGFDREEYYSSQGYFIMASINQIDTHEKGEGTPLWTYPKTLAHSLKEDFTQLFGEYHGGVVNSIIFGDTDGIDEELYENMRTAGISHIISVSGMHIGFLVGFVLIIFGRKVGTVLALLVILIFLPMVGMTPSAIRASIMYGMLCIAFVLNRERDSKVSLFVALLVLLLLNPYSIMSLSLQLSFLSTLGILMITAKTEKLFYEKVTFKSPVAQKGFSFLSASLSCTIGATIFTTPVLMYTFGTVTFLSPIANILAVPLVSLVFPLCLIAVILFNIFAPIAGIIAKFISILLDILIIWVDILSKTDYMVLYTDTNSAVIFILILYVLAVIIYIFRNKKAFYFIIAVFLITTILGNYIITSNSRNEHKLIVFPSGSSQTLLLMGEDRAVVIDCSVSGDVRNATDNIKTYLDMQNISEIDLLILTSVDKTHGGDLPELFDEIPVKAMIKPQNYRENENSKMILNAIESHDIHVSDTKFQSEILDFFNISIFEEIDRKLIVKLGFENNEILILNAVTQNMLLEFFENTVLDADTVIVSQNMFSDGDKLDKIMDILTPHAIIANAYTEEALPYDYAGIEIQSPITHGIIKITEKED